MHDTTYLEKVEQRYGRMGESMNKLSLQLTVILKNVLPNKLPQYWNKV